MTLPIRRRCLWCGGLFPVPQGPGRPPIYCQRSHRQRAFEARRLASVHHLGEEDALISARALRDLHDALYVLEAALDDVDADLAGEPDLVAYRAALAHLQGAAEGLRGMQIEPKAMGITSAPIITVM